MYSDRLEVWNPAELPKGMTIAKLYKAHKSYPTNPFLARAMFLRKYIEETGTGAKDMIEKCAEYGLPKPCWILNDGDDFRVVILRPQLGTVPNKVPDEVPNNILKKTAAEQTLELLCENPRATAETLGRALGISDRAVRKIIAQLKADGILMRIGSRKSGYWQLLRRRAKVKK